MISNEHGQGHPKHSCHCIDWMDPNSFSLNLKNFWLNCLCEKSFNIYYSLDPATNSENTNPEFSQSDFLWQKNNRQTRLVDLFELLKKIREN